LCLNYRPVISVFFASGVTNIMPLKIVIILGSAPNATKLRDMDLGFADSLVVLNNAWQIRSDWTHLVHPDDFDRNRLPAPGNSQTIVTFNDYVPSNNAFGGVVYCGGTMAFSAGYWALETLQPDILGFFGCDMIYDNQEQNHFYGIGTPDPLRDDPTLQSLEAKSARLLLMAANSDCVCLNLSDQKESRLTFPKATVKELSKSPHACYQKELERLKPFLQQSGFSNAVRAEQETNCFIESGDYWNHGEKLDPAKLGAIDQKWLEAMKASLPAE